MALTIGARLRRAWPGLFLLLLLCAALPGKAHEIRPALLELTQLTETEWRLRFRQPQMMGRVLPLVPQSNCAQEERGVTLAVDAVETEFRLRCPEGLTRLAMPGLERTLADAMVTLLPLTGEPQQFSLSPRNPERDLRQGAAVPAYLALGVEHLVFGIDHVCFVLLLVYLYPTLRQLLLIVTSFTLAHSLTLGLASLGVLTLPGGPVEALIALSIVLLAAEALGRAGERTAPALAPWKLCFAFGLLHGLGFAGALESLGLPPEGTFWALLLFNVGLELGQLGVVVSALLLGGILRHFTPKPSARLATLPPYVLGSLAAFWFVERTASVFTG